MLLLVYGKWDRQSVIWDIFAKLRCNVTVYSAIHKAAGRPAAVQNGVWRSFCMAVPHRHFSVLQGTAG